MAVVHVLLQADPGTAGGLLRAVSRLPQVRSAELTCGAYDVIARAEVSDEFDLAAMLAQVRANTGLARLCLCRPGEVGAAAPA